MALVLSGYSNHNKKTMSDPNWLARGMHHLVVEMQINVMPRGTGVLTMYYQNPQPDIPPHDQIHPLRV